MQSSGRLQQVLMWALFLSSAPLVAIIFTAMAPVLPNAAAAFGGGERGAFFAEGLLTAPSIGLMLGGPIMGLMVERFGPHRVLPTALLLYAVSGTMGLYVTDPWPLLVARGVQGFAAAGFPTSILVLISRHFDETGRARIVGLQGAVGSTTSIILGIVGGTIASNGGWQAPFALYGLSLIMLVVAAVVLKHLPRVAAVAVADRRPWREDLRDIGKLSHIYALKLVFFAAIYLTSLQVPFLLEANGVIDPAQRAWILASTAVTSAIFAGCYGWIEPRLGRGKIFFLLWLLFAVGLFVLGVSQTALTTTIGCAIIGVAEGIASPFLVVWLLASAPERVRGRAIGLNSTALFLGQVLIPFAFAPLRQSFGIHGAFIATGVPMLIAALFTAIWLFAGAGRRRQSTLN